MTSEAEQESFFAFFSPNVTDLASLLKIEEPPGNEDDTENVDKVQRAEAEYELASLIRTRIISRAVLLFTGEDDADMYSNDDDDEFDEEDDDDDEEGGGDHGGEPEEESDESDGDAPGHRGHQHGKKGMNNGRPANAGCGKRGKHAH